MNYEVKTGANLKIMGFLSKEFLEQEFAKNGKLLPNRFSVTISLDELPFEVRGKFIAVFGMKNEYFINVSESRAYSEMYPRLEALFEKEDFSDNPLSFLKDIEKKIKYESKVIFTPFSYIPTPEEWKSGLLSAIIDRKLVEQLEEIELKEQILKKVLSQMKEIEKHKRSFL